MQAARPVDAASWATPVPGLLWARPGTTLVVPSDPSATAIQDGSLSVKLDGVATSRAKLVWIGVREPDPASLAAGEALAAWRWLDRPLEWYSLDAPQRPQAGAAGGWFALVDIPATTRGGVVSLDGKQFTPAWGRDAPFQPPAHAGPIGAASPGSSWAADAFGRVRTCPLMRWRARLARGEPVLAHGAVPDAMPTRALEALAGQIESQWAAGLEQLEAADPATSLQVRARLALMLEFPGGLRTPAWTADAQQEGLVLADLTDPTLPAKVRVQRAAAWLRGQAPAASWVIDDAGATDSGSQAILSSVGVANLRTQLAAANVSGTKDAIDDMVSLPPMHASLVRLHTQVKTPEAAETAPGVPIEPGAVAAAGVASKGVVEATVRIGDWEVPRRVVARPLVARPPGLVIGPLAPDWTMSVFMAAASDPGAAPPMPASTIAWTSAGLLFRDEAAEETDRRDLKAPTSWRVFVECRTGADGAPAGQDVVRLYFGPQGAPRVILSVHPDGSVVTGRAPAGATKSGDGEDNGADQGTDRVAIAHEKDRWWCWVPVPAGAVESMNGSFVLRMGITRVDGRGDRSAWPRPILPWQTEPGRVLVDLSQWSKPGE